MDITDIVAIATPIIAKFEGCRLHAYRDAVGVLTIAYGETMNPDGSPITADEVWTQEQCDARLAERVTQFANEVVTLITVPLSDQSAAALVSFAYNVGIGSLKSSTLLRLINEGQASAATAQFMRWNKAGGRVLSDLTMRRGEEASLFQAGLNTGDNAQMGPPAV